ncbi:sensor domain-containing diguanylate cyclase [Chondromyces apiculatus]|nr:diguanylate cyclase [Chondromyces apiculatus]
MLSARRAARRVTPLLAALGLAGLVLLDATEPLDTPYAITAAVALALLLGHRGVARRVLPAAPATAAASTGAARRRGGAAGGALLDLEIGSLLVIAAVAAVLRLDGTLDGRAQAAVYVVIALVSAFARPVASIGVVLFAGALDVAVRWATGGSAGEFGWAAAPHLGFMAVFAVLNAAVLRAELGRVRRASRGRLQAEIERLRDDARSYRLLTAPSVSRSGEKRDTGGPVSEAAVASAGHGAGAAGGGADVDVERLVRSGVEEIHQSVLFALRLLRESLRLHTAMLLWQNDAGTHLRISELASDATDLLEGPFLAGDGVFGAALTQRSPVVVDGLKPGYKLPYYEGPCPARAVCALPVFEHGRVRGVLVVDRVEDRAFLPKEVDLVEEAARYAVRAIQNERVFVQLERAKAEQGKLYRAAEALGRATTEGDVVDAGVRSAREITSVDFAAVTLFDEANGQHEISAASGEGAEALLGQRFRQNAGLVSMALQNRHPLPYRGEYDEKRQVVFTRRVAPPSMPSIYVMPLLVHDQPLGALVLGSRRRAAFNDSVRGTLEVLASHMAVSLSNARMLRRLEELATTDGMTGLLNKRAMLDMAEQKLTAARRFQRRLTVMVTDIDFFKKVNDTYGHDAGDVIIKGLGEILRKAKRTTDAVARFGGEEFVVICEETDAHGAMLLAERVREELERATFHTPGKEGAVPVQVTCSVGVATFPEAGSTWDELFKAADEALYVSKRSGRNRTTAWSPALRGHTSEPPKESRPAASAGAKTGATASAASASGSARLAGSAGGASAGRPVTTSGPASAGKLAGASGPASSAKSVTSSGVSRSMTPPNSARPGMMPSVPPMSGASAGAKSVAPPPTTRPAGPPSGGPAGPAPSGNGRTKSPARSAA